MTIWQSVGLAEESNKMLMTRMKITMIKDDDEDDFEMLEEHLENLLFSNMRE